MPTREAGVDWAQPYSTHLYPRPVPGSQSPQLAPAQLEEAVGLANRVFCTNPRAMPIGPCAPSGAAQYSVRFTVHCVCVAEDLPSLHRTLTHLVCLWKQSHSSSLSGNRELHPRSPF
jgi:hypothetical protein